METRSEYSDEEWVSGSGEASEDERASGDDSGEGSEPAESVRAVVKRLFNREYRATLPGVYDQMIRRDPGHDALVEEPNE